MHIFFIIVSLRKFTANYWKYVESILMSGIHRHKTNDVVWRWWIPMCWVCVCVCKCVRIYDSRNTRWSDHVVNVYASKVLAHVFLLTTNKSITLFGQLNEFDCICNFNWTWFSPPFTYFKCSTEKKAHIEMNGLTMYNILSQ